MTLKQHVENNQIVNREITTNCEHKIVVKIIDGTNIRHCEKCGMVAHEDGSYDYRCGSDWCRCGQ